MVIWECVTIGKNCRPRSLLLSCASSEGIVGSYLFLLMATLGLACQDLWGVSHARIVGSYLFFHGGHSQISVSACTENCRLVPLLLVASTRKNCRLVPLLSCGHSQMLLMSAAHGRIVGSYLFSHVFSTLKDCRLVPLLPCGHSRHAGAEMCECTGQNCRLVPLLLCVHSTYPATLCRLLDLVLGLQRILIVGCLGRSGLIPERKSTKLGRTWLRLGSIMWEKVPN